MTAAAPSEAPAASPVTLDDMAQLRAVLVNGLGELDELLEAAERAVVDVGGEEAMGEVRQLGASVRLLLQLGGSRIDGITAHLRARRAR